MDSLQAVASPRKRAILRVLWAGERSAGDVHRAMPDITFGAVSQHLKALEGAGLLRRRDEGRHRFYGVHKDRVGELASFLESMWSSALATLTQQAELEEARRGPRPHRRRGSLGRKHGGHPGGSIPRRRVR